MEKKSAPASPATARASSVLPVPGGPHSSTPLGTLEPERLNLSGFKKKSTTSISSSFASPMPATSAKVMLRPRVRTARRKSRAGWCGAWCTVSYAARTKPGIAGGERSARAPLLFLQLQAGGAARPRALARALLPGRVCLRAARSRFGRPRRFGRRHPLRAAVISAFTVAACVNAARARAHKRACAFHAAGRVCAPCAAGRPVCLRVTSRVAQPASCQQRQCAPSGPASPAAPRLRLASSSSKSRNARSRAARRSSSAAFRSLTRSCVVERTGQAVGRCRVAWPGEQCRAVERCGSGSEDAACSRLREGTPPSRPWCGPCTARLRTPPR